MSMPCDVSSHTCAHSPHTPPPEASFRRGGRQNTTHVPVYSPSTIVFVDVFTIAQSDTITTELDSLTARGLAAKSFLWWRQPRSRARPSCMTAGVKNQYKIRCPPRNSRQFCMLCQMRCTDSLAKIHTITAIDLAEPELWLEMSSASFGPCCIDHMCHRSMEAH